jgi:CubicO group peptidase (beta-lactamase class C family)
MHHLRHLIFTILFTLLLTGCSKDDGDLQPLPDPELPSEIYFPAIGSDEWETISPAELEWSVEAELPLLDLLEEKKTKAFIILKDGKIAMEHYFGTFTKDSLWYWASAGKTLTSFTVGIARQEGLLDLEDKTSDYLGNGWTSATAEKEALISIRHQLTMTTGLDDLSFDCITPDCLEYKADAGTRWAYHNGPYTLLHEVVAAAAGSNFSTYFKSRLRDRIGMNGFWLSTNGLNSVYFSNARSMARFGLLALNSGKWGDSSILEDENFLTAMKNTSQELNPSYGYLWWLNGKDQYMVPGLQLTFNGPLIPAAPADTYAGLGKNDQKLYLVPTKGLVVVRMGEDAGGNLLGPTEFDNELWEHLNALIP